MVLNDEVWKLFSEETVGFETLAESRKFNSFDSAIVLKQTSWTDSHESDLKKKQQQLKICKKITQTTVQLCTQKLRKN